MSHVDNPVMVAQPASPPDVWERLDARLERWADHLNPILVKETRQALKSHQFLITFMLLLLACWLWSVFAPVLLGPGFAYASKGADVLYGYLLILSVPLVLIVPFAAFRSLAAEQERNTYELLAISDLSARQIVTGKLGSAVVQIVLYLSAVAPCLAFTYLLRGIDIFTIMLVIYYALFGSLGLTMIALLIATLSTARFSQVMLSVALVIGLFWGWFFAVIAGWELTVESASWLGQGEFWYFNGLLLTVYVGYFALLLLAAAAGLGFVGELSSATLRIAMLLVVVGFTPWVTGLWLAENGDSDVLVAYASLVGVHWYVLAVLMTGESPHLSQRVRRSLPTSWSGQALFTWLQPGPGTGFCYAITNLMAVALLGTLGIGLAASFGRTAASNDFIEMAVFLWLGVCYVTIYLGLGHLLIRYFAQQTRHRMLAAVLIHGVLLAVATIGMTLVQLLLTGNEDYTLFQLPNGFWTVSFVCDGYDQSALVALIVIPVAALLTLLANFRIIGPELRRDPAAIPDRVAADDAEQHVPPEPAPESPWD